MKTYKKNCIKCGKEIEVGRLNMGDYIGGHYCGNDNWKCTECHENR